MTDQELIRALRCCVSSPRLDKCREECVFCKGHDMANCIPQMGQAVADRLTAVLGELERVTRERDAAVECIQFIATYMELDSMKDIRKMIETWKADGRRRKREKDTHMQAVRVHDADRQSTNYWQQPSGRATRRLYV